VLHSKALATALLGLTSLAFAADVKPILPAGIKPAGAYSPGILTSGFLYVSGQGAQNSDGKLPDGTERQMYQCLQNVKTIVEAAGLTMNHVVYVQVYLTDHSSQESLDRAWKQFFPSMPPARSTIEVGGLHNTTVEMNAVVVKDLSSKKIVAPPDFPASSYSPGVRAGNRLFVSGVSGRDIHTGTVPADPARQVELAFDQLNQILKAAGGTLANLVFVNPYLTSGMPAAVMNRIYAQHFEFGNTPARATIAVAGLPDGANIQFTGVAVLDLAKRQAVRPKNMEPSPTASPCVLADDTLYCSAKSGFIPGVNGGIYASTVETQLRQTMRNLLDGLEEAGMNFSNVVAANVYLNDINDFAGMNKIYAQYFKLQPPSRTTLQQIPPVKAAVDAKDHWPTLEQISIIALK
jgi:enamine deaminase RidA (YjgF/YER057c/UK114 family)